MKGGIEFGREAISVASNAIHIVHSGPHALASGLEGAVSCPMSTPGR